ncbi:hypothetical protein RM780_03880 [Streptomyces sp. DSM 44917]|uniref:Uncharacterized protein n=1 Tax=Streptomyces boetiae TaxID=3075541 RepID=A0ABU2L3L6_9ACTN|nr:hypothetical protein [Streptomyces sp. DSM 44917]MDT0306102.1 hypothetical protein [Streptomyces sp. DSM 44917]
MTAFRDPHVSVLSDADAASTSRRAASARANTTIGDAIDTWRANLVTTYYATRDHGVRQQLLVDAAEYGLNLPGEPSLVAELAPARRNGWEVAA